MLYSVQGSLRYLTTQLGMFEDRSWRDIVGWIAGAQCQVMKSLTASVNPFVVLICVNM